MPLVIWMLFLVMLLCGAEQAYDKSHIRTVRHAPISKLEPVHYLKQSTSTYEWHIGRRRAISNMLYYPDQWRERFLDGDRRYSI